MHRIMKRIRDTFSHKASFNDLLSREIVCLYAGDVPQNGLYEKFVGLSLTQANSQHIKHDVTKRLPIRDSCVDIYQSEDVFEHIDPEDLTAVINEVYRVLKPGGIFRLSLPDYQCDIFRNRTLKDKDGNFLFDPGGGGDFKDGKVINGGHVWFPEYQQVRKILESTPFKEIRFYHYYNENGEAITNTIDYSVGHVMRTPDHDERAREPYRPMSIVVDCVKN